MGTVSGTTGVSPVAGVVDIQSPIHLIRIIA
jgi:hypothetical protein